MRGRSLLAATSVAFFMAAWVGCSGKTDSPGETNSSPDAGGSPDATSMTSPDANTGPDPKPDASTAGNEDFDAGTPVDVSYGTCQPFTACGGNIVGTWKITGGCVSNQTFADLKSKFCEGIEEGNVVIKAAGTLTATDTTVTRQTKVDISADAFIPQQCAAKAGGSCQIVEAGLSTSVLGTDPPFDKAKCTTDGAGGCNCSVSKAYVENVTGAYTASGNTITTTNPNRTFDYCVDGSKLTYQETTSAGTVSFPIIVELAKN